MYDIIKQILMLAKMLAKKKVWFVAIIGHEGWKKGFSALTALWHSSILSSEILRRSFAHRLSGHCQVSQEFKPDILHLTIQGGRGTTWEQNSKAGVIWEKYATHLH